MFGLIGLRRRWRDLCLTKYYFLLPYETQWKMKRFAPKINPGAAPPPIVEDVKEDEENRDRGTRPIPKKHSAPLVHLLLRCSPPGVPWGILLWGVGSLLTQPFWRWRKRTLSLVQMMTPQGGRWAGVWGRTVYPHNGAHRDPTYR